MIFCGTFDLSLTNGKYVSAKKNKNYIYCVNCYIRKPNYLYVPNNPIELWIAFLYLDSIVVFHLKEVENMPK